MSPLSREFRMRSPTTAPVTTCYHLPKHTIKPIGNTNLTTSPPNCSAAMSFRKWPRGDERHVQPMLTNNFHPSTLLSPMWMSGPCVHLFAEDDTVVHPQTYSPEPYPGYHAGRPRHLKSVNASHFHGFSTEHEKPRKNVAATERARAVYGSEARIGSRSTWPTVRKRSLYPLGRQCPMGGGYLSRRKRVFCLILTSYAVLRVANERKYSTQV